eukprot:scaffold7177_cov114-Isochrysis_galbana.AAC.4
MSPEHIPHVDPCKSIPQEFMHLELDGLLRSEFAYLVYSLVRVHAFCTLGDINRSITAFPWPQGHKQAREQDAPGTHDAKRRAPVHGHTGAVPPDKALSDTLSPPVRASTQLA